MFMPAATGLLFLTVSMSTAAAAFGSFARLRRGTTFHDKAAAGAEESAHLAVTGGAGAHGRVGDILKLFKLMTASVAGIFIGWHRDFLSGVIMFPAHPKN